MPIIPEGIEPFTITAPLTTGDLGEPSSSVKKDAQRVFDFITDERHLTADKLHQSVKERIDEWKAQQQKQQDDSSSPNSKGSFNRLRFSGTSKKQRQKEAEEAALNSDYEQAEAILQGNQEKLETLSHRCRLFRIAQKNLTEEEEWVLASSHFGIDTFYRREEDGTLSLKMEGEMSEVDLFSAVAVLKEVDLYYKWSPFCTSSMTVADLDKLDTVGWFMVGLSSFGLARDGCFRAIGCDNIIEDGSILLAGQGIKDVKPDAPQPVDTFLCNDPVIDKLRIPPIPSRRGADRMTIRKFDAIINVTSPTSAVLKIVANIDPNISFLPQSLLEFVMKHLCGILLAKLQGAAKKVVTNPVKNEHARRMRQEEDFYRRWLMAKFEAICESKGWEMPPVNAFELTEEELIHERNHSRIHPDNIRRGVTFSAASGHSPQSADVDVPEEDDLGSEVSGLTTRSGGSWRRPLRTFARKREVKKAMQKEKEIHEIREIAARRMIPKGMSPAQRERLEQLRDAKARRAGEDDGALTLDRQSSSADGSGGPGGMIIETDPRSLSEKVTDRLRAHGTRKRFFVMSLCLSLFFILVNPDLLQAAFNVFYSLISNPPDDAQMENREMPWWLQILETMGFLFYLLLCTVMHFATCDIALVYAYDSLELGSKAGKQVRKYYSDNVRILMAGMSIAIYVLSIGKALLRVILSFFVAGSFAMYITSSDWLLSAWDNVVESSGVTSESAVENATEVIPMMNNTLPNGTDETLLNSTTPYSSNTNDAQSAAASTLLLSFVKKLFAWTAGGAIRRIFESSYASSSLAYVASLLDVKDFEDSVSSWRTDALNTASIMYSYTLIPLVIFLVLFNYSARRALPNDTKRPPNRGDASPPAVAPTVTSPQETSGSSDYANDFELPQPRVLNLDTETSPNPKVFCKPLRKKNRQRGYFRRRKHTSSALEVVQEVPSEQDLRERTMTM